MLPRSVAEEGEQQIRRYSLPSAKILISNRKRYIGNDITTVVFQDKGCFPQLIRSQFLHNYIIVSPIDIGGIAHYKYVILPCVLTNELVRVAILRQEDVPESKPTLCVPAVMTAEHLAPFLTSKSTFSFPLCRYLHFLDLILTCPQLSLHNGLLYDRPNSPNS